MICVICGGKVEHPEYEPHDVCEVCFWAEAKKLGKKGYNSPYDLKANYWGKSVSPNKPVSGKQSQEC